MVQSAIKRRKRLTWRRRRAISCIANTFDGNGDAFIFDESIVGTMTTTPTEQHDSNNNDNNNNNKIVIMRRKQNEHYDNNGSDSNSVNKKNGGSGKFIRQFPIEHHT